MIGRALASMVVLGALAGCECSSAGTDAGRSDGGAVDAARLDAGAADAGAMDAAAEDGAVDAGASDGGARDAATGDAAALSCDPSAVTFTPPSGGPFEVGVFCDDVFACVATMAEAGAVTAASGGRMTCAAASGFPCGASGYACIYQDPAGPSTIDAAEYGAICAVTVLTPTPDVRCVVYL
ncbi:MAG: hypothetical protein AB7S26_34355 [Sandaracinaceae bacterium]